MNKKTKAFLKYVGKANPRQKSSIESAIDIYYEESDYVRLDEIINYYSQSYRIIELANSYNLIVKDIATETKFFLENGRYRFSSFAEIEKRVYGNNDYMEKYMIGLALSGYLWSNHIKLFHWFSSIMSTYSGDRYLEIGPGHGRYFCEAAKNNRFGTYDAIDISDTSVNQTVDFISYYLPNDVYNKCKVFKQDAYCFIPEKTYDFVVVAEVLEHLEMPDILLKKIFEYSTGRSMEEIVWRGLLIVFPKRSGDGL